MKEKTRLNELTACQLLELIKARQINSSNILDSVKDRIKQVDSKIKAYVRCGDLSFSSINNEITKQPGNETTDILSGIPVSIKDNICTEGYNTECCSKILQAFKPPYHAFVIKRLLDAGARIFPWI